MTTTPQERLALGVGALLLSVGVGVRALRQPAAPAEWLGAASGDSLGRQRERAQAEGTRERLRDTPPAPGERIDPNRASADELQRLPRVGPALANRIVAHREASGPFRSLADLDAVSGVGPAMLASIAPHLTLPQEQAPGPAPAPARAPAQLGNAGALDLNTASAQALEALPGIGPALAERIVRWRTSHGPFGSVDELANVPGVGPKSVQRLRPMVRISS